MKQRSPLPFYHVTWMDYNSVCVIYIVVIIASFLITNVLSYFCSNISSDWNCIYLLVWIASRCKVFRRLKVNQRLLTVFATNRNSVDGKSPKEGSDVNETSNASQGPPLLTILAGFFVLLVFCWSIWSIIAWLISLIVTAPAPK